MAAHGTPVVLDRDTVRELVLIGWSNNSNPMIPTYIFLNCIILPRHFKFLYMAIYKITRAISIYYLFISIYIYIY
uniref:Uncharacterized protein n=1 Tax=Oryza brachyantha TaxID=4533 RepID=J3N4R5_ORYBR